MHRLYQFYDMETQNLKKRPVGMTILLVLSLINACWNIFSASMSLIMKPAGFLPNRLQVLPHPLGFVHRIADWRHQDVQRRQTRFPYLFPRPNLHADQQLRVRLSLAETFTFLLRPHAHRHLHLAVLPLFQTDGDD